MRKQFVKTLENLFALDEKLILLLGDIGVYGFRNIFRDFPERIYNIGILEQAMTSMAAGLSKEGFRPVIHSIAPFVVERCFEQLKIDAGYQRFPINVVSVGASYDYAALGCTHHCPGDVSLLMTIPGMNIIVPGSDADFDTLFRQTYQNKNSNYFRLTEKGHSLKIPIQFGIGSLVKAGSLGTVIAIGPMIEKVVKACEKLDVTILYYTTISPFDSELFTDNNGSGKVAIVEPYYEGTTSYFVLSAMKGKPISIENIGVPRIFLTNYGTEEEQNTKLMLDVDSITLRLKLFFDAGN
jgi:transketolase